jgi:hypothetical protein
MTKIIIKIVEANKLNYDKDISWYKLGLRYIGG